MATQKVGIREFRAGLADFITSEVPIAITKHGQTVGFFVPAHDRAAEVAALKSAAAKLDELLELSEAEVDQIVGEFDELRRSVTK
jgi:antitoxin (DNA-binding transcriptional repressor) of toxin-antitoxin stability system